MPRTRTRTISSPRRGATRGSARSRPGLSWSRPDRVPRSGLEELPCTRRCAPVAPPGPQRAGPLVMRPSVLESLALLERHDLILEIPVVFPRHFDDIVALAERFPRSANRDRSPRQAADRDRTDGRLAGRPPPLPHSTPRCLAKISGIEHHGAGSVDARRHSTGVETRSACFGADRLMCGSDWPVALLNGTYDRGVGKLTGADRRSTRPAPRRCSGRPPAASTGSTTACHDQLRVSRGRDGPGHRPGDRRDQGPDPRRRVRTAAPSCRGSRTSPPALASRGTRFARPSVR